MKKIIYLLVGLGILICQRAFPQAVSQETAQRVAEKFFYAQLTEKSLFSMQTHFYGNKEQPTMYVFSIPDCWVLVAGDRRVQPVLAYSDENSGEFPIEENMPPAMLYMLDWYSAQIDALRTYNEEGTTNPQWNSYLNANDKNTNYRSVIIGPLLTRNNYQNAWNQSGNNTIGTSPELAKSYNKFCPPVYTATYSCTHAVTGCVALALHK